METRKMPQRIAILGAGPSGMSLYKRLVESGDVHLEISIFEKHSQPGAGMPYSSEGANMEHITNVSANEIPEFVTSIKEWVQVLDRARLDRFGIEKEKFNEYKVLPRLFFGEYLSEQFRLLQEKAQEAGIQTILYKDTDVTDILDQPQQNQVWIETGNSAMLKFDCVVICTGHSWPHIHEGKIPGYYDSPYPPCKLLLELDHPIALKGSSLTAIDAIRTLSRCNGRFQQADNQRLSYKLSNPESGFRLILHSRNGLLPGVRFHLEDSHLKNDSLLTREEIAVHIAQNGGFLSLDFLFEKDFKNLFIEKDPDFYHRIKDLTLEEFVDSMMELRESLDPFVLLKAEYAEAEKSIRRHQSVYWKEMLAILSFAMNYPAKHFSAEDMLRLQRVLKPLISVVIAFVPQSSCLELMALHEAGILDIVAVGDQGNVEPRPKGGVIYHFTDDSGRKLAVPFRTFIDCTGQAPIPIEDFPFKSLTEDKTVNPAYLYFRNSEKGRGEMENGNTGVSKSGNGQYCLKVPGIGINDHFQVTDAYGAFNDRIFIMAVPYIAGFNPDYSGLDFCEEASLRVFERLSR